MAAEAVPHIVVVVAVPAICFVLGRSWWGLTGGVILALAWNGVCQAVRYWRGERISAVLAVSMAELLVKTAVALGMHSARAYFIAPAIMTGGLGATYIISTFTGSPLVSRMVQEFLPSGFVLADDPNLTGLLRKATFFYGVEQILSAGMSVIMVVNVSTVTYATLHPLGSWLVLGVSVLAALPWLRRDVAVVTGDLRDRLRRSTDLAPALGPDTALARPS